jgi:hypothetical protein
MAAGTTKRITERVAFTGGKVDRTGAYPVIRGALICGASSLNNRRYEAGSFRRPTLYAGKPAYLNHADRRTVEGKVAWCESEGRRADGMPTGDFGVNPKHPYAETLLWLAEHKPDQIGLSHVVDAKTRYEGGVEIVEEVTAVESIDFVADPATTHGMYESQGGRRMKLKEYVDRLARVPTATTATILRGKRLAEADGMGELDMPAEAPAEDADAGITAAFEQAIMSIVRAALADGQDKKAVLKKIGKLLDSHGDATGEGGEEAPADDAGEGGTEEGKKKKRGGADPIREAIEVCRKVGFKGFDADDLETVAGVPAARREAVAKRLMGAGAVAPGERPESGSRDRVAEHRDEQEAARKLREGAGAGGGKKAEERVIPEW